MDISVKVTQFGTSGRDRAVSGQVEFTGKPTKKGVPFDAKVLGLVNMKDLVFAPNGDTRFDYDTTNGTVVISGPKRDKDEDGPLTTTFRATGT